MNKRIHELIKQADKYGLSNVSRDSEFFHTISMKKFAELLIRECSNWIENATVTDSAGNKDCISDSFFWAGKLKKDFGVDQ